MAHCLKKEITGVKFRENNVEKFYDIVGRKMGNWLVLSFTGLVRVYTLQQQRFSLLFKNPNYLLYIVEHCGTNKTYTGYKKSEINLITRKELFTAENWRHPIHTITEKQKQAAKNQKEKEYQRFFNRYKYGAKNRNLEFTLTFEEFKKLTSNLCYYCGELPNQLRRGDGRYIEGRFKCNGIDRVNNKEGYTKENSVSCCKICNRMKGALELKAFVKHLERLQVIDIEKIKELIIK